MTMKTSTRLTPLERLIIMCLASSPLTFDRILQMTGAAPSYLLIQLPRLTNRGLIQTTRGTGPTLYSLHSLPGDLS
jgi:DNA-binding IscR family transcriptional regulator